MNVFNNVRKREHLHSSSVWSEVKKEARFPNPGDLAAVFSRAQIHGDKLGWGGRLARRGISSAQKQIYLSESKGVILVLQGAKKDNAYNDPLLCISSMTVKYT